jgi:hypothetical protein
MKNIILEGGILEFKPLENDEIINTKFKGIPLDHSLWNEIEIKKDTPICNFEQFVKEIKSINDDKH